MEEQAGYFLPKVSGETWAQSSETWAEGLHTPILPAPGSLPLACFWLAPVQPQEELAAHTLFSVECKNGYGETWSAGHLARSLQSLPMIQVWSLALLAHSVALTSNGDAACLTFSFLKMREYVSLLELQWRLSKSLRWWCLATLGAHNFMK